ncbi:ring-cleaving dioxygenase [Methylobacterium sp. J-068]|uniref:ring-cleaving dioxygenase n=1 Tax=Methylobacterium sp. J-068 TaxID=2836649 RepID=UPI001FBA12B9|nr:ring-cleaving dioxygenase [Methylobacterium sp. J-068]MCJ2035249.1 ring-cleaving dioxygenase [Methylobacterium sp. J-068]
MSRMPSQDGTARNGLHHVTAFSGAAARNRDFYTRILGLRLVKRTVNFDDPGTHHLYYGDAAGNPGTILTFFPVAHAAPGRVGIGETQETAFRVPRASIGWWTHRFVETGVTHDAPTPVFGEPVLRFRDPDGMMLALVGVAAAETQSDPAWTDGTVPAEHAIRGFHGVTLLLREAGPTAAILTDVFGFHEAGREDLATRYAGGAEAGGFVTLRAVGEFPRGRQGAGSVHHIAFRAADDAAQAAMVERLTGPHGLAVTEQRDRQYFRSVYFREPGGVLFEIATDGPGFAVDETAENLGRALKLPAFLEPHRARIEDRLPELA